MGYTISGRVPRPNALLCNEQRHVRIQGPWYSVAAGQDTVCVKGRRLFSFLFSFFLIISGRFGPARLCLCTVMMRVSVLYEDIISYDLNFLMCTASRWTDIRYPLWGNKQGATDDSNKR